ncbi:hypothetical protein [Nocardioides bizhenqiangii]|uniref:Uncharacterized protein n=1 Tax=Nocardioides bizhenqiangii TaxID=3095076 RepID=A0ABZ0ZS17_9ACTN|nr:hypothetical protein [Nocardioides sp. HM61]WQQ27130.1 hypothetical protein SHK19_02625 [Nocardioides sp. HM61]
MVAVAVASPVSLLGLIVGAASILVVLALASPMTVRAVRRWLRTGPRPSEGQLDTVVRALATSNPGFVPFQPFRPFQQSPPATDEELCRAWCASYGALHSTTSRRKLLRIVEERAGHLDEMEKRNPGTVAAWVASGATAADNPLPYLSLAHIDRGAINWDDLIDGRDQ